MFVLVCVLVGQEMEHILAVGNGMDMGMVVQ